MLLLDSIVVALAQENRQQSDRRRSLTAEELEERKQAIVSSLSQFHHRDLAPPQEEASGDRMDQIAEPSSRGSDRHSFMSVDRSSSPEHSRADLSPDASLEAIFSKLVTREQEKIRKSVSQQHEGKNDHRSSLELWDQSTRPQARAREGDRSKEKGYYSPHYSPSPPLKIPGSRMLYNDHDQGRDDDEDDEFTTLSPTTVFHYGKAAETSSSESTPPPPASQPPFKVKDLNSILPFPASFPSVTSPIEALLLANDFSFSMSQAVPDSPPPEEEELHAISPLSFDTGSPCHHILPGRLDFYTHYRRHQLDLQQQQQRQQQQSKRWRAKSGPAASSSSLWGLTKSISFSGGGVARHSSSGEILFLSRRSLSQQPFQTRSKPSFPARQDIDRVETKDCSSRSSSKNSNTTIATTASSEFSIELNGSRPSGIDASALNSSRYLDLDFTKSNIAEQQQADNVSRDLREIKAEIRSRVEEVVRNTDESKFTFSPVNSSFLFPKSVSRDDASSTELFSGSLKLDAFLDFEEKKSRSVEDGSARARSVIDRMYGSGRPERTSSKNNWDWMSSICCCAKRSK